MFKWEPVKINLCYMCGIKMPEGERWEDSSDINKHLCASCGLGIIHGDWAEKCRKADKAYRRALVNDV